MGKVSKYKSYEGKRVNEVSDVKVIDSENYLITRYEREKRPSKSKRGYYYAYKLQLEGSVWISVQTFNKYTKRGFFSKQLKNRIIESRLRMKHTFDIENNDLPLVDVVDLTETVETVGHETQTTQNQTFYYPAITEPEPERERERVNERVAEIIKK